MRVMFYWTRGLYLSFKFNCVIVHVASHSTRVMTSPRCRVSTKQVLQAPHHRSRSFTTCPIFTRIPSPLPSSAVFTTGFIGCHLHPGSAAVPRRIHGPCVPSLLPGDGTRKNAAMALFNIRLVYTRHVKWYGDDGGAPRICTAWLGSRKMDNGWYMLLDIWRIFLTRARRPSVERTP